MLQRDAVGKGPSLLRLYLQPRSPRQHQPTPYLDTHPQTPP